MCLMTMENDFLVEGLESQLLILQDVWQSRIGDSVQPNACAFCFFMEGDCACVRPALWPVQLVILKLRSEIDGIT